MSFEGYEQVICANGHLSIRDVFWHFDGNERWECPDCGAQTAWVNVVDETNGDEYGFIEMEPFVILPSKWGWRFVWRKMTKGFVKVEKRSATYRVPSEAETRSARTYLDPSFGRRPCDEPLQTPPEERS